MSSDSPIALSVSQHFELEKIKREIDTIEDVERLRKLAKDFASMWISQKAACLWVMRQNQERLPSKSLLDEYLNPTDE